MGRKIQARTEKILSILTEEEAFKVGEFTTKTGRQSPFFVNIGNVSRNDLFKSLCSIYAQFICDSFQQLRLQSEQSSASENASDDIVLYGPAYKGIPLCVGVATELAQQGVSCRFAFNRKEKKDHGEGGSFIGASMKANSRIIIVEDILTGGASLSDSIELLKPLQGEIIGASVIVDRAEHGKEDPKQKASDWIFKKYGVPVKAMVGIAELLEVWKAENKNRPDYDETCKRFKSYQEKYWV